MASIWAESSPESWEVINFVDKEGNTVKGLPQTGLKGLPKIYIQPLEERLDMTKVAHGESIPIIDMSNAMIWTGLKSFVMRLRNWEFSKSLIMGCPCKFLKMWRMRLITSLGYQPGKGGLISKEVSPTNNVRLSTSFSPEAEKN